MNVRVCLCSALTVAAIAAGAGLASAQVVQPPPRIGGLFGGERTPLPNRAQHELEVVTNLLGGYDDNISGDGVGVSTDPFAPRRSGTTALATSDLRYRRIGPASNVQFSLGGNVNAFRNIDVKPLVGGNANLNASRRFGGTTISGGGQVDYRPTFTFGVLDSRAASGVALQLDPTSGVSQIRSLNLGGVGSVSQQWNPRHRTDFFSSISRNTYTGDALDMRSINIGLDHSWSLSRRNGIQVHYGGTRQESLVTDNQPVDSHTLSLGPQIRIPVSRTRTLSFAGGPGVIHVRARAVSGGTVNYTTPTGFFTSSLDLGRTWALTGDWHRQASLLDGLSRQSFLTDSTSLSLGGQISRSWTVAATGSYSQGGAHKGDPGSFESVSGTMQLQYGLTRCCSLVGGYTYYQHRIEDIALLAPGFPRRFERNSVRIGITTWLPLYGSFPGGRRASGRN